MSRAFKYITLFLLLGILWTGSAFAVEQVSTQESLPEKTTPAEKTGNSEEAVAPKADDLWQLGCTAYLAGNYREAITDFEKILAQGLASSKLYYNLGNSYFKEEQLGKANLYYHRALKLAPGNEDYRFNLSVAEARTRDKIERVPEFFLTEWVRTMRQAMSCTAWTTLSLVLLVMALGLTLAFLLAQRITWRKIGFYGTCLTALLFIFTTWMAWGERKSMLDKSDAIVMSSSVAVKSSPDKSGTDLFILHEGTSVKIMSKIENWCEVTIADGKKGWVEFHKLEKI